MVLGSVVPLDLRDRGGRIRGGLAEGVALVWGKVHISLLVVPVGQDKFRPCRLRRLFFLSLSGAVVLHV